MVIKSRDKLFVHGYVVDRAGKALVYKVSRLAVNTIRNFILLIFEKHYILLKSSILWFEVSSMLYLNELLLYWEKAARRHWPHRNLCNVTLNSVKIHGYSLKAFDVIANHVQCLSFIRWISPEVFTDIKVSLQGHV